MPTHSIEQMVRARPEVAWEIAPLLPLQSHWSEQEYLWIANRTNKLVELSDGYVQVLPMPSPKHQKMVLLLYRMLFSFVEAQSLGTLLVAPLSVRLWPGKFREPDLVFILAEHAGVEAEDCWNGADLVVEVVSPTNSTHDPETKRHEYAQAGIPEYWIVHPAHETISVLYLDGASYAEHGVFRRGSEATSPLLKEFAIAVDAVLDAK